VAFVGGAGPGFSDKQLGALYERLVKDERAEPPCGPNAAGELPRGREHHWVEPRLVAEVKFTEVTEAGQLRHPVFVRLRDDKRIEECTLEAAVPGAGEPAGRGAGDEPEGDEPPAGESLESAPRPAVRISRPEKVFWPAPETDPPVTKGELIAYYREVAPWLLPYLRDRPVVLDRYPDGIGGKNFFQKNVPDFVPEWIRTETIWSEDRAEEGGGRETRYVVCDDLETLTWLINLGTIPLHLWSSRVGSLGTPDWSILDLDAKQATFGATVTVARAIRRLCKAIELDCFVKTSGATGMHVLLPLGGLFTHDQSRQLAELIARVIVAELPEVVTVVRSVADREGRVYLDYLQNGHGKLLVAPFSVRPRPGAPVSTPLAWREVGARLDPARHNLRTVPARLKRMKRDPLRAVLDRKPDLARALELLAARV
jgi:bifunctional non-homologous end joining protein LigD